MSTSKHTTCNIFLINIQINGLSSGARRKQRRKLRRLLFRTWCVRLLIEACEQRSQTNEYETATKEHTFRADLAEIRRQARQFELAARTIEDHFLRASWLRTGRLLRGGFLLWRGSWGSSSSDGGWSCSGRRGCGSGSTCISCRSRSSCRSWGLRLQYNP